VIQGLTLAPLIRLLKLDGEDGLSTELADARRALADAALATLAAKRGPIADHWRFGFETARAAAEPSGDAAPLAEKRRQGLAAMRAQRERLDDLRRDQRVGADAFLILQEELDFAEVTLTDEDERHIEES